MATGLRFGSVCSGIEAASVAWEPLGWRADWFSEIEKFPSAVLRHHWPHVPNLGDMLNLADLVDWGFVSAPDILVGGTPCQSFSVAGRRKGLKDARGQLTLAFIDLADAIDRARSDNNEEPCIIVWENVPGALSSKDNAFGCFLAGLAGEDVPLVPPGKRWSNAGYVLGPQRAIAWRVLDAQYFGLAQRRRRVFVVASAREDFDPSAVLFEREGVRRDSPPSRASGSGTTHPVAPCLTSSGRGVERPGDPRGQDPVVAVGGSAVAFGGNNTAGPIDVATARVAHGGPHGGPHGRLDFESETFLVEPTVYQCHGSNVGPMGTLRSGNGNESGGVPFIVEPTAFSCKDYGADSTVGLAPTMRAMGHSESHANAGGQLAVAFAINSHAGTADGDQTNRSHASGGPVECERLQGFPDGHTDVPTNGKPAADGPRYKAIGNSMATKVMAWIGRRIKRHLDIISLL